MFTDSSIRQNELAINKFAAFGDHWKRTATSWFDGSVDSVDRRIAQLDRVITFAADTTSRLASTDAGFICASAIVGMHKDREALASLREALLTGDVGEPLPTPPAQYVAAVEDFDQELIYLG